MLSLLDALAAETDPIVDMLNQYRIQLVFCNEHLSKSTVVVVLMQENTVGTDGVYLDFYDS